MTLRAVALLASAVAIAGCDESAVLLSTGTASTLQVTAFVDVDGDGLLGAGDETLAGLTITATGPVTLSGETSANGTVTIAGLQPGTYVVSASGAVPSGTVLSTAANPSVIAPFQGAELETSFRYAFAPGAIVGRLYRDDNDNGQFDADTDLAAAGIAVSAERASDGEVFETITDAEGAFEIRTLRKGTYVVTFGLPTDASLVGGNALPVEVGADGEATLDAEFEGELLIDIADARTAPIGQSVTVEGVIAWAPGFDDRVLFVQDATGGLSVFDNNLPAGLTVGDRIRMTGSAGAFDGERQINSITAFEVLSSGPPPVPVQATGASIAAGENLGTLVTIDGTVEQIDVLSFGNQMILLRDASGDAFTVYADSRTGVEESAWQVGQLYGVTGPLGTDEDVGGTELEDANPNRVEVRGLEDVQRGGATVALADARNAIGTTVAIEAVITWVPSFDSRVIFLQDETGGLSTFDSDLSTFAPMGGFQEGQLIRAVATVGAFRGEVQLNDFQSIEVLGTVALPAPEGVTGASINAGEDQGELVTITATVDAVEIPSFDNQRVTMTDGAGTTFTVYADGRTGLQPADWTVGERYRVTGVLGSDDRNTPAAQLEPRGPADQVVALAGEVSIAEARALPGETVTVTGTVSRRVGWSGGDDAIFIQDASAGIAVFGFGAIPAVDPGDVVRIEGVIGDFNGEVQIGPTSVTVVSTGGPAPTPVSITGAQINQSLFQGQLATYSGTVTEAIRFNDFGTASLQVTDSFGTSARVFVDNRSGLSIDDFAVGQELVIIGIPSFFDGADPGGQLEVIIDTDVTFVN
jgi:hypothetical protein